MICETTQPTKMPGDVIMKLPKPMVMEGNQAENWESFQKRWNLYNCGMEIGKKQAEVQVSILKYAMGEECCNIVDNLSTLTAEEKEKNPDRILEEVKKYFTPTKSVIRQSVVFHTAKMQSETETGAEMITRLRTLVKDCKYNELPTGMTFEDRVLRDKAISCIRDNHVKERIRRLQEQPTVDQVLEQLKTAEAIKGDIQAMSHERDEASAHSVSKTSKQKATRETRPAAEESKYTRKTSRNIDCQNFCGGVHHKGQCPAYGKTCQNCNRPNHFAKVCRSKPSKKKVYHTEMDPGSDSDDSSEGKVLGLRILSSVNTKQGSPFILSTEFTTKNTSKVIYAQMDTGANCSVMSLKDLKSILGTNKVNLQKSPVRIKLYDESIIKPLGRYTLNISVYGSPQHQQTFEIIENSPWPVIDADTCVSQGWISLNVGPGSSVHQSNIESHSQRITEEYIDTHYKDLFEGLGCLPGECHLDIDKSVRPVQHVCRRSPIAIKPKFKAKLDQMDKTGIITKVTEPTEWISSSVPVLKPDGSVRVCLDPKDLNKALRRPKYQIPTLDEVLPDLAKAKIFSVLDAKEGFHQVRLDEESSYATTFWTPFGRYRYLRMPMGISTASEEFQRRQIEAYEGLEGVKVIADDTLAYEIGNTYEEAEKDHDNNLIALFERAREKNIKYGRPKLKLKMKEAPYMDNLLTQGGLKADPKKIEAISEMPRPEDKKGVQRLMGCIQYLSRFLPNLTKVSEPLRALTENNVVFN